MNEKLDVLSQSEDGAEVVASVTDVADSVKGSVLGDVSLELVT